MNQPAIVVHVALPPAKLPAWDGELRWLDACLANVPRPSPGKALINQLAKAKLFGVSKRVGFIMTVEGDLKRIFFAVICLSASVDAPSLFCK